MLNPNQNSGKTASYYNASIITGKKKSEVIYTPSTWFNEVWHNFFNLILRVLQKELQIE